MSENLIINEKYLLLIISPTIRRSSDSDEHKYPDQEIRQRNPPTKEKHINDISTCDEMTWHQQDKQTKNISAELTSSTAATAAAYILQKGQQQQYLNVV